ncbi:MAG: hypothetical protein AAF333_00360 [Planctomycetota bacterium]
MNRFGLPFAAAALITVSPLAHGQFLLTSFEPDQLQPFEGGVPVTSGPGITEGITALSTEFDPLNSYQPLANLSLNDLGIDFSGLTNIVIDANHDGPGAGPDAFAGFSAAIFTDAGGFVQLQNTQSNDGFFFGPSAPGGSQFIDVTYNVNAAQVQQLVDASNLADPGGFSLGFFANNAAGFTGTGVIDNVRLIGVDPPTPAELLITSYEPDNAQPEAGTGTLVSSGPGITDGSFAVSADFDGQVSTYTNLTQINLNQFEADYSGATSIAVDFGFTGDPGDFTSLQPGLFFADSEGNQTDFIVPPLDSNGNPNGYFVGFTGDGFGGTDIEFTLDSATIALLQAANDSGNEYNLGFYANSAANSDGTFIIDNIRILGATGEFVGVEEGLIGDFSGDGFVGQDDLNLILLNFGATELPDGFDITGLDPATSPDGFDGIIGQNELNDVLLNFGNSADPAANTIPEPASIALLAGAFALISRRRA